MKYLSILLLSISMLTIGCSKTNSKRPTTRISIENSTGNTIQYGSKVIVNLAYKSKASQLEKIDLFFDNHLIKTIIGANNSVEIDSKYILPGNHILKAEAITKKGQSGTNYKTLLVLSNVAPKLGNFETVETLPHDSKNFTQGFEFYEGKLYEGTGNYNESKLLVYDPDQQKTFQEKKIEDFYFGEGVTIFNGKLYQLTYKAQKVLVYNANTLERLTEFTFKSKEGWGLTHNDEYLIMSDGSYKLFFIEPETFKTVYTIDVTNHKNVVNNINELEYVDGYIYANIWLTQTILKIEATTGRVITSYNMSNTIKDMNSYHTDVLNGIAYNAKNQLFYLTGKYYPTIFKGKFSE